MPFDLIKSAPPATTETGVWVENNGSRFLIASSKSNKFQAASTRARLKYSTRQLDKDPALYLEIAIRATAQAVLLDWENVESNGTPVPATLENKMTLLKNVPEFRDWLQEQAGSAETFSPEAIAEDAEALKSEP